MRNIESISNFMSIFYPPDCCFIQGFAVPALSWVQGGRRTSEWFRKATCWATVSFIWLILCRLSGPAHIGDGFILKMSENTSVEYICRGKNWLFTASCNNNKNAKVMANHLKLVWKFGFRGDGWEWCCVFKAVWWTFGGLCDQCFVTCIWSFSLAFATAEKCRLKDLQGKINHS